MRLHFWMRMLTMSNLSTECVLQLTDLGCVATPCNQILKFFFFNDTATTEIYTLSLHDALPISGWPATSPRWACSSWPFSPRWRSPPSARSSFSRSRSEEHTSELQSLAYLVCRLLLEKKKPESLHNQNETPLLDENAHNVKSVHGVRTPTYRSGLRRDTVQPDIEVFFF